MSRLTLVLVPHTGWVAEMDIFGGTGVLVLDELLMSGLAGVYFRRLRVSAAMHPTMRAEFDRKRHAYLQAVLADYSLPDGVVVVGTHPTDVDLLEYDHVCAVRVADRGMREMSKLVYGDPVMLYAEYFSVLRAVDEAVDDWHHVVSWHEITMLVMRQFPKRVLPVVNVSAARQRALLASLLVGEPNAAVWLEDDLRIDVPMTRHFLVADYDYLTVIRPAWRDAVVRLLGSAPAIEDVFRLPWYVVDPKALNGLCFRSNVHGMPAVSTRGQSLVEFVRTRLSSVYTTRELVGTWIGGFLCDDVTAVDTIASLGVATLAPLDTAVVRRDVLDQYALHVPPEFSWMYQAVPDVKIVPWDGPRKVDGLPRIDCLTGQWAFTLRVASLYASAAVDRELSATVIHFFQRLHASGASHSFVDELYEHASDVLNDGLSYGVFKTEVTPLLPGFNYLFCFVPSARYSAVQVLGCNPQLSMMLRYATQGDLSDGLVSVGELCAEASRTMVYAGKTTRTDYDRLSVGFSVHSGRPGYCYLSMFKFRYHGRARRLFGAYPMLCRLLQPRFHSWYIPDVWDSVYVSCGFSSRDQQISSILHFSLNQSGVTLRSLLSALGQGRIASVISPYVMTTCVGASSAVTCPTGCYGSTWYVAAIVAWTMVGCALLAMLVWFFYVRCISAGGSGAFGRRRR